jgi:hypothetical protein
MNCRKPMNSELNECVTFQWASTYRPRANSQKSDVFKQSLHQQPKFNSTNSNMKSTLGTLKPVGFHLESGLEHVTELTLPPHTSRPYAAAWQSHTTLTLPQASSSTTKASHMFDPYQPSYPALGKSNSTNKLGGAETKSMIESKNYFAKKREEERILKENVRLAGKIVSVRSELSRELLAKSVAKVMTLKAIHQKEGHRPYGSQILEEFDRTHELPERLKQRMGPELVFKPVDSL